MIQFAASLRATPVDASKPRANSNTSGVMDNALKHFKQCHIHQEIDVMTLSTVPMSCFEIETMKHLSYHTGQHCSPRSWSQNLKTQSPS